MGSVSGVGSNQLTATITANDNGYIATMNKAAVVTIRFANAADAASKTMSRASKAQKEYAAGWRGYLDSTQEFHKHWTRVSLAMGATALVLGAAIGMAANEYAAFEQAMDNATAVADMSQGVYDQLSDAALTMGKTTKFSAMEAAAGIESLLKAGVSTADVLGGALKGAIDLATAGELSLAEAAETASIMMIQFGQSGADIPHVADVLAAAAGKAVGDVHDMVMALKQGGLVASQFGLSMESTAGTLAMFAQNGLIGSDAGTALKIMLIRLAAPSTKASKLMSKLGLDVWDANGAFVGMAGLATELTSSLKGMSKEQQNAALATIFGTDAMRSASIILKEGTEGVISWEEKVNDAGYAAEVARKRMDNLRGDLKRLQGAWQALVIGMGEGSNNMFRDLTQDLTGLINTFSGMPKSQKEFILQAGMMAAAASLTGFALIRLTIMAGDLRNALQSLNTRFPGLTGKLGRLGAQVGVVSGIMIAASIAGRAWQESLDASRASVDEISTSMMRLAFGTVDAKKELDAIFSRINEWDSSTAFSVIGRNGFWDQVNDFAASIFGMKGQIALATEEFSKMDEVMVSMSLEDSQAAFAKISDEAMRFNQTLPQTVKTYNTMGQVMSEEVNPALITHEELMAKFPQQTANLARQAEALGVVGLTVEDYYNWMRGNVPAAVQAAIAEHDDLAGGFGRVASAADDAQTAIAGVVTELLNLANGNINAERAQMALNKVMRDAKKQAKDNNAGIEKNTEAAQANRDTMIDMADATWKVIESQKDLTPKEITDRIEKTRKSMREFGKDVGASDAEIEALINSVLGVPDVEAYIRAILERQGIIDWTSYSADEKRAYIKSILEDDAIADWDSLTPSEKMAKLASVLQERGIVQWEGMTIDAKVAALESILKKLGIDDWTGYKAKEKQAHIISTLRKQGIDDWRNYNPPAKNAYINVKVRGATGAIGMLKKADGGIIPGFSPHPRADNIPIAATAGEFMQPVRSVQYYGFNVMEAMRRNMIPRSLFDAYFRGRLTGYADGGLIGRSYVRQVSGMLGAQVSTSAPAGDGSTHFHFDNARIGAQMSDVISGLRFGVQAAMIAGGMA